MKLSVDVRQKIYAGVLGKMIGVYLGRPVEGWPYGQIRERFGEVPYYVHEELDLPLIVADDDLSGTFAFFRAVEDSGFDPQLTARQIGDSWLNYIMENKSILWWGGMGNSTEHTAFLRLKSGIPAPQSGSMALNGPVISQQIGAQIFMDAYAMMCPGDPERANRMVRACAGVSHDGIALDAAGFLGSMEAYAFDHRDLDNIFDHCTSYIQTAELRSLVDDVRNICAAEPDWRRVREALDSRYGYHIYPGPCHMVPNHAMVLAAILCAGDDFAESVKIGASAAWDTDCNAGNVGCFNGIRLGLEAINARHPFREPVADRMYVITSDGGEGITDAVKETRRIIRAAEALAGNRKEERLPRFGFEFPGSVQGFMECPYSRSRCCRAEVSNPDGKGLQIGFSGLAEGVHGYVSAATFLDIHEEYRNYETYVSPTLYSGQDVTVSLYASEDGIVAVRPYIWLADRENRLQKLDGPWQQVDTREIQLNWTVPDIQGLPVLRFGLEFKSRERFEGTVTVAGVDWSNTPRQICQKGIMMRDMWDTNPFWAKMFVSGAKHFAPNLNATYCISHDEANGVATMGTRDFTDYTVSSVLKFSLHRRGGLVARSRGHRRYYAAVVSGGDCFQIIKRRDGEETVLAQCPVEYRQFEKYPVRLTVKGNRITASFDRWELTGEDPEASFPGGGAGFLVEEGAIFIDGFVLEREES